MQRTDQKKQVENGSAHGFSITTVQKKVTLIACLPFITQGTSMPPLVLSTWTTLQNRISPYTYIEDRITRIAVSALLCLALKLAGELGDRGPSLLKQVIAISPPAALQAAREKCCSLENLSYQQYFLAYLKEHVERLQMEKGQTYSFHWPAELTFPDFDDVIVAPTLGCKNAEEYYAMANALPLIPKITIPCKILFAEDDPIIPSDSLDGLILPDNVSVFKTEKGGHLGFLAHPKQGKGFFWLDTVVVDWLIT
jgi:pimeloyl-ACP methyl ester carboxylesterase